MTLFILAPRHTRRNRSVHQAHIPDGFLATRTEAGQVTTYTSSARGELTRVALPDNRIIDADTLKWRITDRTN